MLEARYVHLHDALGLGPMWLKREARIVHNAPSISHADSSGSLKNPPSIKHHSSARLNVLQQINQSASKTQPIVSSPVQNHVETHNAHETEKWQNQLSGSIKPVKLMVLSMCASPANMAAGQLFDTADGTLLDKMLAAIHLSPTEVLINTWLKNSAEFRPNPPITVLQHAFPRLQAEYRLSGEPMLLLLGELFHRPDVLEEVQRLGANVQYFIIPHPNRINLNPQLKRPVWNTLQQIQTLLS